VVQREKPSVPDRQLWDMVLSVHTLPSLKVADESGIFMSLAAQPATITELSEHLGFDRRALAALIKMLAALGLLARQEGRFRLTELARIYLLKDSPFYWGPLIAKYDGEGQRLMLEEALRGRSQTGSSGADGRPEVGRSGRAVDHWASGQIALDEARSVAGFMHSHSLSAAIDVATSGRFSGVRKLLDVGGGSGCFSVALAQQHEQLRCTVMELPAMCEVAKGYIEADNVASRVDTEAVDMFREAWPTGYDAMLFANIFHDWDFETGAFLARRAYDFLPKEGRIYVYEMLFDEDGIGPPAAASFSMLMLHTQGQQFTFAELKSVLERAGFTEVAIGHRYGYYSLVMAHKP
jgi:acetylserotonin N-methyltransferase